MRNEEIINDLFEAARTEQAVRPFSSVKQFIHATPASTSSSLVLEWLKRNKMNMLISTSGIIITATILLFPEREAMEKIVINEVIEPPIEEVVAEQLPETVIEEIKEANEIEQEARSLPEEEPLKREVNQVEPEPRKATTGEANPVAMKTKVKTEVSSIAKNSTIEESLVTEHSIVLESNKGRASVKEFSEYLKNNLSQLSHEFTSSATKSEIKKFTLKLDNRVKADFRMQVAGFEKMEFHWGTDANGELKDVWYRLDGKEIKELDFSRSSKFSIKVKHRHQEF